MRPNFLKFKRQKCYRKFQIYINKSKKLQNLTKLLSRIDYYCDISLTFVKFHNFLFGSVK